jgi:hypothetical protein
MTDTAELYTAFYSNDVQWMLRKDAPEPVRDDLLPRVSSPLFFEQTAPAKAGASKSLWLAALPIGGGDRSFIIKRYENKTLPDRLKTLVRPSKARRELEAACGVSQRGIPTPVPIAIGVRRRWGMTRESFVILEKMSDCQDLNRFFLASHAPGASARSASEKWAIIKALGDLARRVNESGVHQSDFALNNFLIERDVRGEAKLYLSDFEKITLRSSLRFDQEITCLAKLNRVGREASLADRMRFLKSYAGSHPRSPQLRALARAIQERTRTILLQDCARGRKTSVYTDALYDRIRTDAAAGFIRKGYAVDDVLAVISRFDLLAGNLPLRETRAREETSVEVGYHDQRRRLKAVRYTARAGTHSAGALWSQICTLALAGFPVSLPPVFLESGEKHSEEGYLFYEYRDGEMPLGHFCVPARGKREIEGVLELLVILLRKLHRFGAFADTMSESTFTVVEQKVGKPALYLSDPESFIIKQDVTLNEKKRNLLLLSALVKMRYPTLEYDLIQRYFKGPTHPEARHAPLPAAPGGEPG